MDERVIQFLKKLKNYQDEVNNRIIKIENSQYFLKLLTSRISSLKFLDNNQIIFDKNKKPKPKRKPTGKDIFHQKPGDPKNPLWQFDEEEDKEKAKKRQKRKPVRISNTNKTEIKNPLDVCIKKKIEPTEEEGYEEARKIAERTRDALICLDPKNSNDRKLFEWMLYYMIGSFEAKYPYAYDDADGYTPRRTISELKRIRGSITVGIGFNMKTPNHDVIWKELVFKYNAPSFEDVKEGRDSLSDQEIDRLFFAYVDIEPIQRIRRLLTKDIFYKLNFNELAALIDRSYHGGPGFVGGSTELNQNIKKYYQTGNPKALEEMIKNFEEEEFKEKNDNFIKRRITRTTLMRSNESPFYQPPNMSDEEWSKKKFYLNDIYQRIPRKLSRDFKGQTNKDYKIWRHGNSKKPRPEHLLLEGLIFKNQKYPLGIAPGELPNFSCFEEELPANIFPAKISDEEYNAYLKCLEKGISGFTQHNPAKKENFKCDCC